MTTTADARTAPADCHGAGAGSPVTHDVVVIGGGQAGLAVAYHLRRAGVGFVVMDAGDRPGHVWRYRWDSLTLFTAARYSSLPGAPFPGDPDHHPGKDEVADYLAAYTERFAVPVRHGTRVTSLAHDGTAFVLRLAHEGRDEVLRASRVVLATGAFHEPVVPELAAGLDASVVQLHTSRYRRPSDVPVGRVLVVGAGNSGVQVAEELAASHEVHLAVGSRPRMVPQRILGRDLFWWFTRLGVVRRPVTGALGRRLRSAPELAPGSSWRRLRRAGVVVRPRAQAAEGRSVRFADGSSTDVDAVVWATGYRSDWSWVNLPGAVVDGELVHDRGVTVVDGLFVVGQLWQHSRGSALLGFVGDDAEYVADAVSRRRVLAG